MDTPARDPGVEVVPLPRDRLGPFLILGVPKDATDQQIDAAWAQRVLWARQGKTSIPLGDIHWAREVLRDPERRLQADAASLNIDTAAGDLARLGRLYGLNPERPTWQPVDPEPPADPSVVIPDAIKLRAELPAPSVPVELPGVARYLEQIVAEKVDPWSIALPPHVVVASKPPSHSNE
ncbi:MAG: hypothetical protein U0746_11355 [Gemmataceae bacterium]